MNKKSDLYGRFFLLVSMTTVEGAQATLEPQVTL